jgi:uncharacterized membrane protein (DUF485 family)
MQIKIRKIESAKIALIFSLAMAALSLLFYPIFSWTASLSKSMGEPMPAAYNSIFMFFPLLYFVFGFIVTYIFCGLINLIMRFTGGIGIEIEGETEESSLQINNN